MAVMTLPITAMPIAPPTSRDRSLMAEATPCLAGGRAEGMALVAGVMAQPIPIPRISSPITSCQYGVVAQTWAMTASAQAMSSSPAAQTRRDPIRAVKAGASRAVGIMVTAIGIMLSAAMSAE